jgi:hypothetical protein
MQRAQLLMQLSHIIPSQAAILISIASFPYHITITCTGVHLRFAFLM